VTTYWAHIVNIHLSAPVPSNKNWREVIRKEDFDVHQERVNVRERRYMDIDHENRTLSAEILLLKSEINRLKNTR